MLGRNRCVDGAHADYHANIYARSLGAKIDRRQGDIYVEQVGRRGVRLWNDDACLHVQALMLEGAGGGMAAILVASCAMGRNGGGGGREGGGRKECRIEYKHIASTPEVPKQLDCAYDVPR